MNPVKLKIEIGIVFILFSLNGCKKPETENLLSIATDDIEIFSKGIYTFKGKIVRLGNEEFNDHGFAIGATYGALYTWPAAMNIYNESDIKPGRVQGVCPDGWHLPDDNEWK